MSTYVKEPITLEEYITEKLRFLKKEFRFKLTEAEVEHMQSLKNEIQVDNYARAIFNNRLGWKK